ncbi:MAG: SIS domain-containing protein [Calditrichaceae bacterium]
MRSINKSEYLNMIHKEFIKIHLIESAATKERIAENCTENISRAVELIKTSITNGGKMLICGNGGSAADAQHLAAEFIIRLNHDIVRPAIPAIALTTDTSILTAGGNDIGFNNIFSRQVEALGKFGDVFLGISTSGNSENVLRAAQKAKEAGMVTIGFLGKDGGKAGKLFDLSINIPSDNTQHIQEGHITIGHIICELVERDLYA